VLKHDQPGNPDAITADIADGLALGDPACRDIQRFVGALLRRQRTPPTEETDQLLPKQHVALAGPLTISIQQSQEAVEAVTGKGSVRLYQRWAQSLRVAGRLSRRIGGRETFCLSLSL
jgi:hypothetical protein